MRLAWCKSTPSKFPPLRVIDCEVGLNPETVTTVRDMWRPLPAPVVGRGRLGASGRLHDLGKRHGPEPRQDLPPEQLWVADCPRLALAIG